MQYEAPFQSASIPVYDFSLGEEEGADRWVESFAREPLPLLDAPSTALPAAPPGRTDAVWW